MWVFLLSESKVVMWYLFSKHFNWRRTRGTRQTGYSVESLFVCWFCEFCVSLCLWNCVWAYECVCLSTAILVCLMGFVYWRPLLRGSISPLALSSISGRLRFSARRQQQLRRVPEFALVVGTNPKLYLIHKLAQAFTNIEFEDMEIKKQAV